MQSGNPYRGSAASAEPLPVRPVTPGQPYRGTMLPAHFILPYDTTPDSPMPHYVPAPGPTGIVVEALYFPWLFPPHIHRWMATPKVEVNGERIPDAAWGATHVPVAPGTHHVRVGTVPHWFVALRLLPILLPGAAYGFADAMVPVEPGNTTTIYYQSPLNGVPAGALGPEPRERFPGWRYYRVMAPILAAIGIAVIVMMIFAIVQMTTG